jgi:hypothetical protein
MGQGEPLEHRGGALEKAGSLLGAAAESAAKRYRSDITLLLVPDVGCERSIRILRNREHHTSSLTPASPIGSIKDEWMSAQPPGYSAVM